MCVTGGKHDVPASCTASGTDEGVSDLSLNTSDISESDVSGVSVDANTGTNASGSRNECRR